MGREHMYKTPNEENNKGDNHGFFMNLWTGASSGALAAAEAALLNKFVRGQYVVRRVGVDLENFGRQYIRMFDMHATDSKAPDTGPPSI
mmetsp:Transcript_29787/g.41139  ORF Transcript_29787/g.41139 Transcript_29787/m.41139 type:complete len:89 (-) Transcript_29787:977-1243(-)